MPRKVRHTGPDTAQPTMTVGQGSAVSAGARRGATAPRNPGKFETYQALRELDPSLADVLSALFRFVYSCTTEEERTRASRLLRIATIKRFGEAEGFATSMHGYDPLGNYHDSYAVQYWTANLANICATTLRAADPYVVEADTEDIISAVAADIPTPSFDIERLPSDQGFIYLHHPLYFYDVNSKNINVRAIAWTIASKGKRPKLFDTPGNPYGLFITFYSDKDDPQDELYQEWQQREPGAYESWKSFVPALALCHYSPWPFNADFPNEGIGTQLRWMAAFFAFLRQKIFKLSVERPPRALARRTERLQGIPTTTIVQLRQVAYDNAERGEAGYVEWSHRWVVRGHWHTYWTGAGSKVKETRYIFEYVKGPADKPLVVKNRIFDVSR